MGCENVGVKSNVLFAWQGGTYSTGLGLAVRLVALGDIHAPFAWQAWRSVTSLLLLRGRHLQHWAGCGGTLGRR